MKTVTVLKFNADTTEGRGPMYVKAIFANPADARKVGGESSNYDMGGGALWSAEPAVVFESYTEYTEFLNGELRTKALAKLTSEERVALGL